MPTKILIVDDEHAIVDILKYNLEKDGFETVCAYDGNEGLRLAGDADPDLILLDVMLPGMPLLCYVDDGASVAAGWTILSWYG